MLPFSRTGYVGNEQIPVFTPDTIQASGVGDLTVKNIMLCIRPSADVVYYFDQDSQNTATMPAGIPFGISPVITSINFATSVTLEVMSTDPGVI